jgi:hypothetical protein
LKDSEREGELSSTCNVITSIRCEGAMWPVSRVAQCAQEAEAGRLSIAPLDPWRRWHQAGG